MKVLVCGGRNFWNYPYVCLSLDRLRGMVSTPWTTIIHGAASGADTLAGRYAREHNIPEEVFRANWKTVGWRAGTERNERMLHEGKPELVVAFPGKTGTKHMCQISEAAGLPVILVDAP